MTRKVRVPVHGGAYTITTGPDERTKNRLAVLIMVGFLVAVIGLVAIFALAVATGKSTADLKDFTYAVLGALGLPVGAIVSYVFTTRAG